MQLTSFLICLMTMAPVVIQAAPIPSNDLSLDLALFPEGELDLVKRVVTPAKPATKPAAKPATKPAPVAAKPVAPPVKPPVGPAPVTGKPPAKPAPVPAKPVPAPAKPAPAPAKPPTTKPPPGAPVKNPPNPPATGGTSKPGLGTVPPGEAEDVCDGPSKRTVTPTCSCFRKCNSCTSQPDCAFSTVTFTCVDKVNGNAPPDAIVGAAKGEAGARCIAVNNQAKIFPPIKINVPGQKIRETPAGLPAQTITDEFNKIRNHIFTLDNTDPKRRDSGQHLKSVWIANHPTGPKSTPDDPVACNSKGGTGLCSFMRGSKTVWNDDPGFYTEREVQNMCSIALKLAEKDPQPHVVMSPMGKKICVFAKKRNESNFDAQTGSGEGSCFPVGTGEVTNKSVNDACQ